MWDKEDVKQRKAKQREEMRHACPRCGADAFKSVLCQRCATGIANKQRAEAGGYMNGWEPRHTRGQDGRYR